MRGIVKTKVASAAEKQICGVLASPPRSAVFFENESFGGRAVELEFANPGWECFNLIIETGVLHEVGLR